MTPRGTGRRVGGILIAIGLVGLTALIGYWWITRPVVEISESLVPDPIEPFGPVSPAAITFRWALPTDHAPVRVEVLDENASEPPLWTSSAVEGDSLRPPRDVAESWPRADLFWRPVAVPAGQPARPGPLAAFTLP